MSRITLYTLYRDGELSGWCTGQDHGSVRIQRVHGRWYCASCVEVAGLDLVVWMNHGSLPSADAAWTWLMANVQHDA